MLCAGLSACLSGCVELRGNSVTLGSQAPGANASKNCGSIAGPYQRTCIVDPQSANDSVLTLLTIDAQCNAVLTSQYYLGILTCTGSPAREQKEMLTLSGDPSVPSVIQLTYNRLEETPLTAGQVSNANAQNRWGYSDWNANSPKDITGRSFGGTQQPSAGDSAYTWFEYDPQGAYPTFYINTETNLFSTPGAVNHSVARTVQTTYMKSGAGAGGGGGGGGGTGTGGGTCNSTTLVSAISANTSPNSIYLTPGTALGQSFSLNSPIQLRIIKLYVNQGDSSANRALNLQLYAFTSNPGVPSSTVNPANLGSVIATALTAVNTTDVSTWKDFYFNTPVTLNAGNYWVQIGTDGGAIRIATQPYSNNNIPSGNGFSAISGSWSPITASPGDDLAIQFFQCQ